MGGGQIRLDIHQGDRHHGHPHVLTPSTTLSHHFPQQHGSQPPGPGFKGGRSLGVFGRSEVTLLCPLQEKCSFSLLEEHCRTPQQVLDELSSNGALDAWKDL